MMLFCVILMAYAVIKVFFAPTAWLYAQSSSSSRMVDATKSQIKMTFTSLCDIMMPPAFGGRT